MRGRVNNQGKEERENWKVIPWREEMEKREEGEEEGESKGIRRGRDSSICFKKVLKILRAEWWG